MSSEFVSVEDFEKNAAQILDKTRAEFFGSGAGEQLSLNLNREAFRRLRIRPNYLQNVSQVDTSRKILGCDLKWPLGISPSACQKLAHPDGEAGNAKAAGDMGSVYILGAFATMTIEEVAEAAPQTNKWFQLFVYKDRSVTEQLVRRAENCNFKAIVLTVDSPIVGQRWMDERNGLKLPAPLCLANFKALSLSFEDIVKTIATNATWNDVKWLVKLTNLPVILKGILTKESAISAHEAGCAGVIVSNHGGRHLDGLSSPIEVLPEIVTAVGKDVVVMLDSGVRSGNDIFKALALGAKMVFIGRPAVWGLACGGEVGVKNMLTVLKNDLVKVMTLAGCQNLNAVNGSMVFHESVYSRL